MTALDQYDRLEAIGIWKQSADAPDIEVLVTFGEATLTFSALDAEGDTPLTHWSMAAIDHISRTDTADVYAPDGQTDETLTVEDSTLRDALAVILREQRRSQDRKLRVPPVWVGIILAGIAVCLYLLAPGVVSGLAHRVISPERATLLATEMIPMIEDRTGPECTSREGKRALRGLSQRLRTDTPVTLHVMDLGDIQVISLPGNVLLGRGVVEAARSPAEVAGWAMLGVAGIPQSPAIQGLFEPGGFWDGVNFLANGRLAASAKNRSVNRMLIRGPVLEEELVAQSVSMLRLADIPLRDFTTALAREGYRSPAPSAPDPTSYDPILGDNDWVALQQICNS